MYIKAIPQNRITTIAFKNDIARFSQVDETLYRGGRPEPEQIQLLKDYGISTVIDFSVEPQRVNGYEEKLAVENLGMKYHKLPFVHWENPSDKQVSDFFEITQKVKANNEKMFIHCVNGKDRTGLFTELYKIFYGLSDAQTSINTLIKGRYNFSENPLALSFIKEFASKFMPCK